MTFFMAVAIWGTFEVGYVYGCP